jgi:glycosyltransferase involved in cell wall biosynthesis
VPGRSQSGAWPVETALASRSNRRERAAAGGFVMNAQHRTRFSIVVPLYNEAASLVPLYVRLTQVMTTLESRYEIIFVDDGSRDGTAQLLDEIYESDSRVKVITLRRNFGQTAALKAGFDAARGDIVISMDGDLQHEPEQIPEFVSKLEGGYDIVSGWRAERQDNWLSRRLPSKIANWAMSKLARVPLHDFGTTFKAYRRETIQSIQLYGDLHRFIPALAAGVGARIAEIPIGNPPRTNGKSNYGISRTFRVFLDLLSTKFLLDYSTRPLHFLGFFALLLTGTGTLMGSVVILKKVLFHQSVMLQNGPLVFGATLFTLAGIQLLFLGLVSEILSHTYYESQKKPIYATRQIQSHVPELTFVAGRSSRAARHTQRPMPRPGYVVDSRRVDGVASLDGAA